MPRKPTSKRYAQAVFQLAQERDALDSWQGDLDSVLEKICLTIWKRLRLGFLRN